jgi:hypothetical protein
MIIGLILSLSFGVCSIKLGSELLKRLAGYDGLVELSESKDKLG